MRSLVLFSIFIWAGSFTTLSYAEDPHLAPSKSDAMEAQFTTYKSTDLRSKIAEMHLKEGRNTIYVDTQGRKLQAQVSKRGVITGYFAEDAAGKISPITEQSRFSSMLGKGSQSLVHKCFVITQECINNPLPKSGKPEDCSCEIPCPNSGAQNHLLTK